MRPRPPRSRSEEHTLNSSHTVIYTLSLHDALPICFGQSFDRLRSSSVFSFRMLNSSVAVPSHAPSSPSKQIGRAHSELQSHSDLHSFPTRRSSDLLRPVLRPFEIIVGLLVQDVKQFGCRTLPCALVPLEAAGEDDKRLDHGPGLERGLNRLVLGSCVSLHK